MRRVLLAALIAGAAVAAPVAALGAGSDSPYSAPTDGAAAFEGLVIDKTRLQAEARDRARAAQRRARRADGPDIAIPAVLKAIAACESGGNPRAIGGGGLYRGLLQFDRQTWVSVGGTGDPAAASVAEQYRRGAILYARAGSAPWPVCGR